MKEDISIRDIYNAVNSLRSEIKECYVSKDEFINRITPVERLVYGMVGIILIAVIGAILALVINKTGVQAKW